MSKIFTTQLIGRLQKISEQELDIEDAARLLAQALVGEGSIYIFGENDLRSVFWRLNMDKSLCKECKNGPVIHLNSYRRRIVC